MILRYKLGVAVVLCTLVVTGGVVSGHHALQAQFDTENPLAITGTLARIDWINPHAYFWINVEDEATGEITQWGAETVGPNALRRAGFARGPASFRIGETYTFTGFASKDGDDRVFTTAVDFPDGRNITIWFGDPSGNQ